MVDDVGSHADHIDIHVAVEEDIVSQVAEGLAGKADHIPRPDLIADTAQAFQAGFADLPFMMAVIGMEGRIESGIAGLDAQQVAVGTGFKPAPIGFFRLFADTKGQAQLAVAQFLDVADQAFDIIDEGLVLPFAGLDSQGAVLILIGPAGHGQNIFPRRIKAFDFVVALADAAVFTIFNAVVGKLDEPPIVDDAADIFSLDGISRIIQFLQVVGLSQTQQGD
ncbi:hypothetical protein HMPREF3201_00910 [Megasphaera sp. MJR8396C]|nr:hypothetical protein HMPREF3201_00910 [Megasphaera sp. MJR8396C]